MIELVVISSLAFSVIYMGQYLALEGQFGNLSSFENIANLWIIPLIIFCWNNVFIFHVCIAMILALPQKFIERLEKVPEKEIERWIFDNLTLFNTFAPKMSKLCLVLIPSL